MPRLLLCPDNFDEYERLKTKVKRYTIAIIPERNYKRHKLKRNRRKYHLHKNSAF